MGKKKIGKVLLMQTGNFIFEGKRDFIECRSVVGDWCVRWRKDSFMYASMRNLLCSEGGAVKDYLHCLATTIYVSSSYVHDLVSLSKRGSMPFMEGVSQLFIQEGNYEASVSKIPVDRTEAEILDEELERQEVIDGLIKAKEDADREEEMTEEKEDGVHD